MKRVLGIGLVCLLLLSFVAVRAETFEETDGETFADTVDYLITLYSAGGAAGSEEAESLLETLERTDPDRGARWRLLFTVWGELEAQPLGVLLPDTLPRTDELCIVVLGYQLEPDGGMRPELFARLRVALACAYRYPNAYILCTGGHTASENVNASEAGRMVSWLRAEGVAPERLIAEDASLTTLQNAEYSYRILSERYPGVKTVAVISSDYHVLSGALLLQAVAALNSETPGTADFRVIACAGCPVQGIRGTAYAVGGLRQLARRYAG